jgi:hypothetical protein
MNKNEQNRVVAWRLKLLREAGDTAFLARPSINGELDTSVTVRLACAIGLECLFTLRTPCR